MDAGLFSGKADFVKDVLESPPTAAMCAYIHVPPYNVGNIDFCARREEKGSPAEGHRRRTRPLPGERSALRERRGRRHVQEGGESRRQAAAGYALELEEDQKGPPRQGG